MSKLTDIADCLKVLDNPKEYTTATYCMAEDELQSYGSEWLKHLISLLEEKDKALQEIWQTEDFIIGSTADAMRRRAYAALTSSNNEGEIE
ncbi:hypothetical protein [Paenibacillus odorifer]|uniref:hypothetical protein n=1 Tax=Paenibacillus odorifer TaxID=189426 RepID=UPI00096C6303|nr:hypothetical protein [Paenibacillus odorifer]OMD92733.1 hypothetical protein BSK67_18390 [Paenibacillus odorifer]